MANTSYDSANDDGSEQKRRAQVAPLDQPSSESTLARLARIEGLMTDQREIYEKFSSEADGSPPFKWMMFRPPCRYHPDSFFNSLEDTPELYRVPQLGKASVPVSLRGYARLPDEMVKAKMVFEQHHVEDIIPMKCLLLSDIRATGPDEDADGLLWQVKSFKYDDSDLEKKKESAEMLSWFLYDSLVDHEVQHRFLTVRRGVALSNSASGVTTGQDLASPAIPNKSLPSKVLELLIYVIHPESAACLGNHVLKYSRFSCEKRNTWVTSITLRSWRVGSRGEQETGMKRKDNVTKIQKMRLSQQQLSDDDPISLPTKLKNVWEDVEGVNENMTFELEVSSVIISTNAFGDFSKCTIVSELLDEKQIIDIVEDARKLWQIFVHQSQTARCLVFFLILSKICQQITTDYNMAIQKLTSILKLDTSFTNTEEELSQYEKYPYEFQLGVYSLEALYKLQNSLNSTVNSLVKAKQELMIQIHDGPGKRSTTLEIMCQEYVDDFENNFVQLTSVNALLERKIEYNTRNKDATSAVLTMRDNRQALRQNDLSILQNGTIEKLTYLTIGYLPIALMASIFAIPPEQRVLWPGMGQGWFVGAIVILSLTTYTMAIYIKRILIHIKRVLDFFINRILGYFKHNPQSKEQNERERDQKPNMWAWFGSTLPYRKNEPADSSDNTPDSNNKDLGIPNTEKSMEEGKSKGLLSSTQVVNDHTP